MLNETSASWLARLKNGTDDDAWLQWQAHYDPFIRRVLSRQQLSETDCDDVVQTVMTVVLRRLPDFDRQRCGSFRKWLRLITINVLKDHWRQQRQQRRGSDDEALQRVLLHLEDPHSDLSRIWDEEHQRVTLAFMLSRIRDEYRDSTWQAFRMVAVDGLAAADVAHSLGISENAVYIARSRVMKRLKEYGEKLLD